MFPVFTTLLIILKSVSQCLSRIVIQHRKVCWEFVKQETQITDLPDSLNGVQHSVYLGFNEEQNFVSFFFVTNFSRTMLYHIHSLSEIRLVQSLIGPKHYTANSPYFLLELIRHIPAGAQRHPMGTYSCAEHLCCKSVFPLMVCAYTFRFSQRPTAISLP